MTARKRSAVMQFLMASAVSVAASTGCATENNGASGGDASTSAAAASAPAEQVDKDAAKALREELSRVGAEEFTAADYKPGRVQHIVLFKFKPDTSSEEQTETMKRFRSLRTQATRDGKPYIMSLDSGVQTSGEGAGS
ncbi:Dabb family protein [Streptomyces sp. NPDC059851]|uniref:Dabb family protein n=1 Tax=Streptomyces sp. NPDC059851 TaxID=3346971 RepID=UPI003648B7F4